MVHDFYTVSLLQEKLEIVRNCSKFTSKNHPRAFRVHAMSDRSARLSKYFSLIEKGVRKVEKISDATLFLEALCNQSDPLRCIEKLVSNPHALESLQNSIRFDVSAKFLNGPMECFLTYLRAPGIEQLCNGQFLRKIISSLVDPPTFWNAFVNGHNQKVLTEASDVAFAWMLLQLLT